MTDVIISLISFKGYKTLNHSCYLKQLLSKLNSEEFVNDLRKKINDYKTFPTSYYGDSVGVDNNGTSHLSVYAPNGDAVSLTSTINI